MRATKTKKSKSKENGVDMSKMTDPKEPLPTMPDYEFVMSEAQVSVIDNYIATCIASRKLGVLNADSAFLNLVELIKKSVSRREVPSMTKE